jgi:hypothetical protein
MRALSNLAKDRGQVIKTIFIRLPPCDGEQLAGARPLQSLKEF